MPPRKKKPTKEEFYQLTRDYNIRFEGPVPPRDWPGQYKHLFYTVRKIDTIRYDDYKTNSRILKERREKFRVRVNTLRQKAYTFLNDVKTNETTWRDLERPIFEIFEEHGVW